MTARVFFRDLPDQPRYAIFDAELRQCKFDTQIDDGPLYRCGFLTPQARAAYAWDEAFMVVSQFD